MWTQAYLSMKREQSCATLARSGVFGTSFRQIATRRPDESFIARRHGLAVTFAYLTPDAVVRMLDVPGGRQYVWEQRISTRYSGKHLNTQCPRTSYHVKCKVR